MNVIAFIKGLLGINVFKNISINLSGPICTCPEQNLGWRPGMNKENEHQLTIDCKSCKTTLVIPQEKLIGRFSLDTPYPGKSKEKPGAKILSLVPRSTEEK